MAVTTSRRDQPDHYAALGLTPRASDQEVVRAFRRLAKELHPDQAASDDRAVAETERFRAVTEAYRVLSDPRARAVYDRRRAEAQRPSPRSAPPRPRPVRLTRRRLRAALWGGVALTLLGVAVAVVTARVVVDGARFRDHSVVAQATVVGGADGSEIEFTTESGQRVRVAEPERANPGLRGDTLAVRYDPDDPEAVRVDESTAARDITFAIIALKLLVGGPVLAVVAGRRLRRLDAPGGRARVRVDPSTAAVAG